MANCSVLRCGWAPTLVLLKRWPLNLALVLLVSLCFTSVHSQLNSLSLEDDSDLPVSWYWNSMIHERSPESIVPVPSSYEDYSSNQLNSLEVLEAPASRTQLQRYLNLVLDFRWQMTDNEWLYYCKGKMPDMQKLTSTMDKSDFFYDMNPNHMGLVLGVSRLLGALSPLAAIRLAACMRDEPSMNTNAWYRGLVMSIINNPLLSSLQMPAPLEVMPGMWLHTELMGRAKVRGRRAVNGQCVRISPLLGADNGPENLLSYFREDVWVNSFHWFWHMQYPFMGNNLPRADRRGELLYYSHHSICARYHSERLSVGLPTVVPLELFPNTIIEQGYNPHLGDENAGMAWTARPARSLPSDVNIQREGQEPMVVDLNARLERLELIQQSIEAGVAVARSGLKLPLRTATGIDLLGDIIESSVYSLNPDLYGYPGVHNEAHLGIGLLTDPDGSLNLPPGVMADPSVAMRDPVFYQYHVRVDQIFDSYKATLPPYQLNKGDLKLVFPGVQVVGLAVLQVGSDVPNKLETYFKESEYDLARGLDFNRSVEQGPVRVCVKHLDYTPFSYEIVIKRDPTAASSGRATIRLFLAPRFDEQGRKYSMDEQRTLYFALDRFPVELSPGLNKIIRRSTDSTLTVPKAQSYETLQNDLQNQRPHCGCGWPEHLLLPRGNSRGLAFDLFAMVTDGVVDAVPRLPLQQQEGCTPAPIFCGIQGQNYPDSRPMGYPFDRRPYTILDQELGLRRQVSSIEEYVLLVPNMGTVPVRIYHREDALYEQGDLLQGPGPELQGLGSDLSCVPYKYRYICLLNSVKR